MHTHFQVHLCRHDAPDQSACIGIGFHYRTAEEAAPLARRCNLVYGGGPTGLRYAVFEVDANTDRALRLAV
jgi:hypothetical protein